MATLTRSYRRPTAAAVTDALEPWLTAIGGFGMAFTSFVGVIPGVLPSLALAAVLVAVVVIPALVVGMVLLVIGLAFAALAALVSVPWAWLRGARRRPEVRR